MSLKKLFIVLIIVINKTSAHTKDVPHQSEEEESPTGLVEMVRSVTKNVPNLSIGPFNIDTRNYAYTLVNLCRLCS